MKKSVKIIALALALVMTAFAFASCGNKEADKDAAKTTTTEAAQTIKFGTNAEFEPFEFVAANGVIGEFDGIDMAIAKQIGEENNMNPQIENMEFDSLLLALNNGQIDAAIAGMTITKERQESVDMSTPYYTATQVMIVKNESTVAKAADMKDKKITVVQGYTGEECVKKMGYKYEAFKKGTEAVLELKNGKCDVVVIDSATAKAYVSDNKELKIVEDSKAFEAEEYGIAVKKGNTELLNKINASIEKMLKDGTIAKFVAKYSK